MNETATKEFVVSRTFSAPRDLVWRAFSESDRLAEWWGPNGFPVEKSTLDFRPGGIYHYGLKSSQGNVMWGRFVYRDIDPQDRIVFVNSFSDENGGVTRAPFNEHWPLEVLSTVTFEESGGKTTVTLRGTPINATEQERQAFEGFFASMNAGWNGTLDQLEEHLAQARP